MVAKEEQKNQRIGMMTSLGIHALLVLLFIFYLAWEPTIPPPEPVGMAMNFGTSESGSGSVQPRRTEASQQQVIEETQEQQLQEAEAQPVEQTQETETEAPDPVTEPLQEEGPVAVEERSQPKPDPQPVEQPQPKPTQPAPQPAPRELENAFPGPKANNPNNAQSQGNTDGQGDQGSPTGSPYVPNQGEGQGGGGGFSHNLTGWGTNFKLPADKPEATGILEFKIRINDLGEIERIFITKRIGNTSAENFYKDLITRQMKFYRSKNGGNIPPYSEGTITLNLRVK